MIPWTAQRVADAAGATLVSAPEGRRSGPARVAVHSDSVGPDVLFVGLPGARVDGATFAEEALEAGAWGALVGPEHAAELPAGDFAVLAHERPLAALAGLARAWRRELGCTVVGVTGSTGKTSTKDILRALLAPALRTAASPANFNTEIGLPLAILEVPLGTEALVLELAMRGTGQIAELAAIAGPDVGVVVNVGPVHLELLGSVDAVAAAKGELLAALRPGGTAVLPAGERRLDAHVPQHASVIRFGEGGAVSLARAEPGRLEVDVRAGTAGGPGGRLALELDLPQAYHRSNLLAAVAASLAVGVVPEGRVEVALGALRGERIDLPGGITVINDCYNANPMSMSAALEDLADAADGRRVAVLGDMLELGPDARRYHAEVGRRAGEQGVELLVAVGDLAAEMAAEFPGEAHLATDADEAAALVPVLLRPGDTVLVKGSRGVGLEVVAEALSRLAEART